MELTDGPLRMYLVTRRGALSDLERACELAGAAAVDCVERFADDVTHRAALDRWRAHPRKVVLRARAGQWDELQECEHVLVGDPRSEAVLALPPRGPSQRGELLGRMQAMTAELAPPAGAEGGEPPADDRVTYLLNPSLHMSSGKTMAQVGHAAVIAAGEGGLAEWAAAGCPARLRTADPVSFARLCASGETVARVVDAGLTEVPPGTVTVLALAPRAGGRSRRAPQS